MKPYRANQQGSYLGTGSEIRTHDGGFKGHSLGPLGDTRDELRPTTLAQDEPMDDVLSCSQPKLPTPRIQCSHEAVVTGRHRIWSMRSEVLVYGPHRSEGYAPPPNGPRGIRTPDFRIAGAALYH